MRAVEDVAAARGATAGRVALAWLAAQGADVVPITGTKRRRHLEDNLSAVDLLLDASEVHRLDGLVAGPRGRHDLGEPGHPAANLEVTPA